jgi:uncharacterized membrane protein
MTRNEFLTRLRRGLIGLSPDQVQDVMNDYEAHFTEGMASGRTEEEIAAALGDPARLARELSAEAGFKRWEDHKTPASMLRAVLLLLGLATLDIMILIPLVFPVACLLLGLCAASIGMFIGGIALSMASLFPGMIWFGVVGELGGALALGLLGIGLIAGGIGLGSLVWLVADALVRGLVRYARLHFQLIDAVAV